MQQAILTAYIQAQMAAYKAAYITRGSLEPNRYRRLYRAYI